jgi:uncharacterized membrane protein
MHFHNLVNHFPIIFPIAGIILLVLGLIYSSELVKRIGYFFFILTAISTFLALNSGEGAEEMVEKFYPSIAHTTIHDHEEKAEVLQWINSVLGVLSLVGIWASWRSYSWKKIVFWGVLVVSLFTCYFGYEVGKSGGKIIHLESSNS